MSPSESAVSGFIPVPQPDPPPVVAPPAPVDTGVAPLARVDPVRRRLDDIGEVVARETRLAEELLTAPRVERIRWEA